MSNIDPSKMIRKGATYAAIGFTAAVLGLSTWFTTEEGYLYFVQNKMTGSTNVYSEPGIHLKMPFFTNVYEYKRVATIDMTAEEGGNYTRDLPDISVNFADTYTGQVPATFRYRLPTDEDNFRRLHQEFRSFDNLVDSLLIQNSRNVAVVTATQYTGEEFIQGGVNAYKAQMEDQLRNGLYVTERRQVEIEDSAYAAVSSENSDANKVETTTRLVWKNVIIYDDATGQPKRLSNPLSNYGITVSQVTIGKPTPDPTLDSLLDKKRSLVGEKIAAQQEIETNRTRAEAATQEREIEKQKAIQNAQREKELAIIAGQQQVEVERQKAIKETVQKQKEAELAIIEKQKELQIAKDNLGIQQANAEAAKFEAQAIKEKGLAEAEVDRAKLQAKQAAADIYLAEIQRDIAQVMYTNLANFKITMPQNYVSQGSGNSMMSNLDVLSAYGALGVMDNMKKKVE